VRLRRFVPAVVLVVIGLVVLAVTGGGVAGTAVAMALAGTGGIWGVAAAFYEIGASEDRDRRSGRA
jgi:hypothetical protein